MRTHRRPNRIRRVREPSGADGFARRDLRAPAPPRQFPQLVLQRKLRLDGVPSSRQLLFGRLTTIDLHAEAFEAERPRAFEHRRIRILEPISRLAFTAPGTERPAAAELRLRRHAPRPGPLKRKLLRLICMCWST